MSVGDWAAVTGYFVLVVLLGGGAIRLARLPASALLHDWSAYYLAGQIVLTLLTLSTGFVPWTHGQLLPVVVVAAACVGGAGIVRAGARRSAMLVLTAGGFLLLAWSLFPNLAVLVHRTPAIETDARSIWLFHGHALFAAGGIDPAFFTDPLLLWSSPDYPLLLPAQAAWNSLLVGRWGEVACRAYLLFQFAVWFRLIHRTLGAIGFPWLFALFLTAAFLCQGRSFVAIGFAYISGQADYHCTVPLILAMLVLAVPAGTRSGSRVNEQHTALVVLLLAYPACTKSEGVVYAAAFAGALSAWCAFAVLRRGGVRALFATLVAHRSLWPFAALCGLLPWGLWSIFKASHGMGSNLQLMQRATTPGLLEQLIDARLPTVLRLVRDNPQMQQTWVMLLVLLVLIVASVVLRSLGVRGTGVRRSELLVALAWPTVMGMICAIYVLTPHDYVYHMETSVERLLFFPHLIVFVACIFRLDVLRTAITPLLTTPARPEQIRPAAPARDQQR